MQTTVGAQVSTSAAFDTQDDPLLPQFSPDALYLCSGCYQELCGQPEASSCHPSGECCQTHSGTFDRQLWPHPRMHLLACNVTDGVCIYRD
jgi:hypothetical protein